MTEYINKQQPSSQLRRKVDSRDKSSEPAKEKLSTHHLQVASGTIVQQYLSNNGAQSGALVIDKSKQNKSQQLNKTAMNRIVNQSITSQNREMNNSRKNDIHSANKIKKEMNQLFRKDHKGLINSQGNGPTETTNQLDIMLQKYISTTNPQGNLSGQLKKGKMATHQQNLPMNKGLQLQKNQYSIESKRPNLNDSNTDGSENKSESRFNQTGKVYNQTDGSVFSQTALNKMKDNYRSESPTNDDNMGSQTYDDQSQDQAEGIASPEQNRDAKAAEAAGNDELTEECQEAKAMVGKHEDELKFRKLLKERLKVTKIPKLKFEDDNGVITNFNDLYEFKNFLGTGSFGFVVSAIDKESQEMMALKIVDAASQNTIHSLKKEAEILQGLPPSNNVIQFKHLREYTNYVIMGIEYAPGGTLLDLMKSKMRKKKHIKDEDCSKIIKGILQGLKHIHRNDYVHRDLKPSNVVIADRNQLENLKLVDFGLAVKYQTRQGMDENCGTLVYQAPEQMSGGQLYGKPVDIWAVGFIMYEIIAGYHPLWIRGEDKVMYKEKALKFKKLNYGKRFTQLQQSLIQKLCHPKPSMRYTVDQALHHPWITRKFDEEIPRNHFEQGEYLNKVDDKFRKMLNTVYFLTVIKNYDVVQQQLEINQKKILKNMILEKEKSQHQQKDINILKIVAYKLKIKPSYQITPQQKLKNQRKQSQKSFTSQSEIDDKDDEEEEGSFNRQTTPFFPSVKADIENKGNKMNTTKVSNQQRSINFNQIEKKISDIPSEIKLPNLNFKQDQSPTERYPSIDSLSDSSRRDLNLKSMQNTPIQIRDRINSQTEMKKQITFSDESFRIKVKNSDKNVSQSISKPPLSGNQSKQIHSALNVNRELAKIFDRDPESKATSCVISVAQNATSISANVSRANSYEISMDGDNRGQKKFKINKNQQKRTLETSMTKPNTVERESRNLELNISMKSNDLNPILNQRMKSQLQATEKNDSSIPRQDGIQKEYGTDMKTQEQKIETKGEKEFQNFRKKVNKNNKASNNQQKIALSSSRQLSRQSRYSREDSNKSSNNPAISEIQSRVFTPKEKDKKNDHSALKDTKKKESKKNQAQSTAKKDKQLKILKSRAQIYSRKSNKTTMAVTIVNNLNDGENDEQKQTIVESDENIVNQKKYITASNSVVQQDSHQKPLPSLINRKSSNDVLIMQTNNSDLEEALITQKQRSENVISSTPDRINNNKLRETPRTVKQNLSKFDVGQLQKEQQSLRGSIPQIRLILSQQQLQQNDIKSGQSGSANTSTALPHLDNSFHNNISREEYPQITRQVSDSQRNIGGGLQRFSNMKPYINYGEEKQNSTNNFNYSNRKLSSNPIKLNSSQTNQKIGGNNQPIFVPQSIQQSINRVSGAKTQQGSKLDTSQPSHVIQKSNTPNIQVNRKINNRNQPNMNNFIEQNKGNQNSGVQWNAMTSIIKQNQHQEGRKTGKSTKTEKEGFSPFENFLLNLLQRNGNDLSPNNNYQVNSFSTGIKQQPSNGTSSVGNRKNIPQKGSQSTAVQLNNSTQMTSGVTNVANNDRENSSTTMPVGRLDSGR